jgi:hypothetical protein
MAKLEIKEENGRFVLYDDGLCFKKYDVREDAEKQKTELEEEDKISDAVDDAVDVMIDDLKQKFPQVKNWRKRISDLL